MARSCRREATYSKANAFRAIADEPLLCYRHRLTIGQLRKAVKRAVLQTTAAAMFVTLGTLRASRAMTHIPNGADAETLRFSWLQPLHQMTPESFWMKDHTEPGGIISAQMTIRFSFTHPGERHFYAFDFGVTGTGKAVHMGNDIIRHLRRELGQNVFRELSNE